MAKIYARKQCTRRLCQTFREKATTWKTQAQTGEQYQELHVKKSVEWSGED